MSDVDPVSTNLIGLIHTHMQNQIAVRELLDFYEFPGDETPIIRGSALAAVEVRRRDS